VKRRQVFDSANFDEVAFLFPDDAADLLVEALLEFGPNGFSMVPCGENDVVGES